MSRKAILQSPQSSLVRMPPTSSSFSFPCVNKHGDDRENGHYIGLDNMDGDVSPVAIDLTGKKYPSASNSSRASFGAAPGTGSGPSSAPSESNDA